ncbi:MAG: excisionase family DNA-binding protein [Planctomycetes bacterium]|nr:excisionase family DNA-binding protein [Planctomycetota bacterium]
MPDEESTLLTTGQAARLCSVTPDTVLKWIKKGRLRGVRTAGGHYRIQRRDIEPLVVSQHMSGRLSECGRQNLRCWEYLSDQGAVRDNCQECVVYRVRAARCFLMADLAPEVGHARQFCQISCEECVYYRRTKGLATNVLVLTSDEEFIGHLAGDRSEGITLRFAKNAYEASAVIHDFRPGFAVIDAEHVPAETSGLLDSLAGDARVPGVRILVAASTAMMTRKQRYPKNDLVVGVLEKPFGSRQIAAVIDSFLVDFLLPEEGRTQAAAREEQR